MVHALVRRAVPAMLCVLTLAVAIQSGGLSPADASTQSVTTAARTAAPASGSAAASTVERPAAETSGTGTCTNTSSRSVQPNGEACIAGTMYSTRNRITRTSCFAPTQATLQPPTGLAIYEKSGCKVSATNAQIESIAQARMIAQLDADDPFGDESTNSDANPEISPNIPFTATAGERLKVSIPSSTFSTYPSKSQNLMLKVTDPDGVTVINTGIGPGDSWIIESAKAGTYTIHVDPQGINTGTTSVKVESVTDLPAGTVTIDGDSVSTTFGAGQNRDITFTATAGERLKVSVPDSTFSTYPSSHLYIAVTDPDGVKVINTGVAAGSSWIIGSAKAGTYTIHLDPTGTDTGTMSVKVTTA